MTQPVRRTQRERSEASRTRLLEAAVSCLADRGYAGTTMPEVLRRAGLSNGAMWRHFPSKAALLSAAAVHAEETFLSAAVPTTRRSDSDDADRLDRAVKALWQFSQTEAFQAVIELLRASRADQDIRDGLGAVDEALAAATSSWFVAAVGPRIADHHRSAANLRQLVLAMHGAALTAEMRSTASTARLLRELQQTARLLFGLEPEVSLLSSAPTIRNALSRP
jgi:AcrR family transcriptional regulator